MNCKCAMCLAEAPLLRLCRYCLKPLKRGRCANVKCFVYGLMMYQLIPKFENENVFRYGRLEQRIRLPKPPAVEPSTSPSTAAAPPLPD